jgi:glycosyltransferase involved in cell wall biosynthesis
MTRLLYIFPGLVPPSPDPRRDRFTFLSKIAQGDVLLPVWWKSVDELPPHLREQFPIYRVGNFSYHLHLFFKYLRPVQKLATFCFYLRRGLQLHREKKFDVIMVYGTNSTGLAATILKWITGAKLIVELPGVPENAFRYDDANPSSLTVVKRWFAGLLLLLVGSNADCFKLLYPWQLQKFSRLQKKRVAVFHDFVPVHAIEPGQSNESFILSIGQPSYTKGMDVLIRGFDLIKSLYPDYKLKLMGWYSDLEFLKTLAGDSPQIEFLVPREHELAMKVMGSCTMFVLSSRTESMGRVLLEAMAAHKPIIASGVGGVPHYIKHNENGLVFQSENIEELSQRLVDLIGDEGLRARLAKSGYAKVFSELDEWSYADAFERMLRSLNEDSALLNSKNSDLASEVDPARQAK